MNLKKNKVVVHIVVLKDGVDQVDMIMVIIKLESILEIGIIEDVVIVIMFIQIHNFFMAYIIKMLEENKYWRKGARQGTWVDSMDKATVYAKVPTLTVNNRLKPCYIITIKIVVLHDPVLSKKRNERLIGSYNDFWRKTHEVAENNSRFE